MDYFKVIHLMIEMMMMIRIEMMIMYDDNDDVSPSVEAIDQ